MRKILPHFILSALVFGCSTPPAKDIGLVDNKFHPCPETPNCYSSMEERKEHYFAPIQFAGPAERAHQKLSAVFESFPRVKVVKETPHYFHLEFRSKVFGFVDDLEVFIDPEKNLIHLKSSSRLGRRDFGVNKKRLQDLTFRFHQS